MMSLQSLHHLKYYVLLTINFAVFAEQSVPQEIKSEYYGVPCVGYKPGEDDLQTLFDVISRYRLDFTEKQYPGVSRVRGTTRMQTAYRIDRDANLTLSTRQVFPIGLPEEFSFTTIFRTWRTPRVAWRIFQISNSQGIPEFSIELNPNGRTLDLTVGNHDKYPQTFQFDNPNLFENKQWHKVQVSVFREKANVYVDCVLLGSTKLQNWWPIDVGGQISISRTMEYPQTVPIDLQWMIVDCDPTKPERERCDELPLIVYEQKKTTCDTVCPQGPPGANGTQGPRGFPGYPGAPGLIGLNGLKGEKVGNSEFLDDLHDKSGKPLLVPLCLFFVQVRVKLGIQGREATVEMLDHEDSQEFLELMVYGDPWECEDHLECPVRCSSMVRASGRKANPGRKVNVERMDFQGFLEHLEQKVM
uniref:COL9A1 protein n=1 Tax=Fopius arisanus TaxID=64838 RepID=A0A0C9RU55_9HYME